MKWSKSNYNGFSLAEITVVLGIIAVMAGIVAPITLSELTSNRLTTTSSDMKSSIIRLQQDSYANIDSGIYGIYYDGSTIFIYEGASYASSVWTEEIVMERGISVKSFTVSGGGNEIHFDNSIDPNQSLSVVLTNGSKDQTLTVNIEGLVDIQ